MGYKVRAQVKVVVRWECCSDNVEVQGPDGLAPDLQSRGAGAQPQVDSLQDGGGDHDHQRGRGGQRLCRYLDIT